MIKHVSTNQMMNLTTRKSLIIYFWFSNSTILKTKDLLFIINIIAPTVLIKKNILVNLLIPNVWIKKHNLGTVNQWRNLPCAAASFSNNPFLTLNYSTISYSNLNQINLCNKFQLLTLSFPSLQLLQITNTYRHLLNVLNIWTLVSINYLYLLSSVSVFKSLTVRPKRSLFLINIKKV